MGLKAGGRGERKRKKFPLCVKAKVIDPFRAAAQKGEEKEKKGEKKEKERLSPI